MTKTNNVYLVYSIVDYGQPIILVLLWRSRRFRSRVARVLKAAAQRAETALHNECALHSTKFDHTPALCYTHLVVDLPGQ